MKNKEFRAFEVLVIDDEPEVASELSEVLESVGFASVGCSSIGEAVALFRKNAKLRILVCDLNLGREWGLDAIGEIRRAVGDDYLFEVIVLTGFGESEKVVEAMRAGASDFLMKPVSPQELIASVERIESKLLQSIRRQRKILHLNGRLEHIAESLNSLFQDVSAIKMDVHGGQDVFGLAADEEDSSRKMDISSPLFCNLTHRQQEVAQLICKGYSNYRVAHELGISENTVKLYITQIFKLLRVSNRTQLAMLLAASSVAPGGMDARGSLR
ncbi:response regulator transcription factor [Pseudomonas sp. JH-2]|uniref:response regulator transcription factor n=1 Tax=Pseudomonas sp. JH-2 TaxID=3114998 RepID=UPI002E256AD0|nr:response regulator transcription factor [Pseudomonas sp. JH-2]